MKRVALWIFLLLMVALFWQSPQGMIYPMALLVVLLVKPMRRVLSRIPLVLAFVLFGTFLGLLTEGFAIASNWNTPADKKVLLHPVPQIDLLFGFFYYSMYMAMWFLLLRKIAFSKTAVYVSSAIFGALVEQGGVHLLNALASPVLGIVMLLIITSVYGIFPVLALFITEQRFGKRTAPRWHHYLVVAVSFFLFWAVYGNFVHSTLLNLFPKGF